MLNNKLKGEIKMNIDEYINHFKEIGFRSCWCPRCDKRFTNMTELKKHYRKCEDFTLTIKNLKHINELEKVFNKEFFKKWNMIVLDKWIDAFREEIEEAYREECDCASDMREPTFTREELD